MIPNAIRAVHALEIFSFVKMFCPSVTSEELLKDLHDTYGPFYINNELVTLKHCSNCSLWIKNPFHARMYDIAAKKIRKCHPNYTDEELGFSFGQYTLSHSNASIPEVVFVYLLILFKPFHESIKLVDKYRKFAATTKRIELNECREGYFSYTVIHNPEALVNPFLAYSYPGKTDMALRLYGEKNPEVIFNWDRKTNNVTISSSYNKNNKPGFFIRMKKFSFFAKHIKNIIPMFVDLYSSESSSSERNMNEKFENFGLSQREIEVVKLVLIGKSNKEIADILSISLNTVKKHLYNIFNKTGVDSRSQLISLLLF